LSASEFIFQSCNTHLSGLNAATCSEIFPATVVPSGTMLSRGMHAKGPIVQFDPMLLSRPMNVCG
jgi:hypothetical protein